MGMTTVTIDGPAGAGKTTAARGLARLLGWDYLDTGAMYRAVAALAVERAIDLGDAAAVTAAAVAMDLDVGGAPGEAPRVIVDGLDVTERIRGKEVSDAVSLVAAHPGVRDELQRRQRSWAGERTSSVIEGRDIGTAVLPDAEVRVYITARPEVRTARRLGEGNLGNADVAANLATRDRIDSSRSHSPLPDAAGAEAAGLTVLDTSNLDIDGVLDALRRLVVGAA